MNAPRTRPADRRLHAQASTRLGLEPTHRQRPTLNNLSHGGLLVVMPSIRAERVSAASQPDARAIARAGLYVASRCRLGQTLTRQLITRDECERLSSCAWGEVPDRVNRC